MIKDLFGKILQIIYDFLHILFEKLVFKTSNVSKQMDDGIIDKDLQMLKDYYKPYNEQLYNLLGREFKWN